MRVGYPLASIVCVLFVMGCAPPAPPVQPAPPAQPVQRANPASQNCIEQGGKHTTERDSSGGEIGVCLFEDNRQCDEWALLRGTCPKGGIRVTGYVTQEERLCAIKGGKYVAGECKGP